MSYQIVNDSYGKSSVKLLHVRREGHLHSIQELEVSTQLTLATKKDYTHADNSDIVATDSQKNTVYILAKKHGVGCPERFALLLCQHFLYTYEHVTKAKVYIEQYPWQRMEMNGQKHNHSFIFTPTATRFCTVQQEKYGKAHIEAGIKDLRVLKTTQSAFVNFVDDEYRSLPDADDRIFSTIVFSKWEYSTANVDFCRSWHTVKDMFLEYFAGPPDTGLFSPSVQNTMHLVEKAVLDKLPEVNYIEIQLPNKHYFTVDLSKFPKVGSATNNEVFQPVDKPFGDIRCALTRTQLAKL